MSDTRIPFGKHRGEKVEDVPTDYLEWALSEWDGNGKPWLESVLKEMENQLALRRGEGVVRKAGKP